MRRPPIPAMIAGDPDGPDIVSIEELPSDALAEWPNRTTDHVIITRRQRAHYLEEHPEMAGFEEALVRTLLDPEPVHVATGPGDTAALCGHRDPTHDIVVIDAVSNEESLANPVITARQQRAMPKWSPANRLRMVWGK